MHRARAAFTLVEVMVSVMIISVVIMALIEMHGNSTHLFTNIKERLHVSFLPSLLIANPDYGYENKTLSADILTKDFILDDDLRRKLKALNITLSYEQLDSMQAPISDKNSTVDSQNSLFYIGKTTLKVENSSVSFLRITTRSVK
jgi:prepilin-type N-terminal cleavage/methylation domain-containing protein